MIALRNKQGWFKDFETFAGRDCPVFSVTGNPIQIAVFADREDAQATIDRLLAHGTTVNVHDLSPTVRIWMDEETGLISISKYSPDDEMYESNHVQLAEIVGGQIKKHSSSLNVLRNVLSDCGVKVEFD